MLTTLLLCSKIWWKFWNSQLFKTVLLKLMSYLENPPHMYKKQLWMIYKLSLKRYTQTKKSVTKILQTMGNILSTLPPKSIDAEVSVRSVEFMSISFTSIFAKRGYHLHFSCCWLILEFCFLQISTFWNNVFYILKTSVTFLKDRVSYFHQ